MSRSRHVMRVCEVLRSRSRGRPPRGRHASRGGHGGVGSGPCRPGCRATRRSRPAPARVVAQHEDGALLGRQTSESALQLVAVGDRQVVVVPVGMSHGSARRLADEAAITRRLGDAGSDEKAMEPGVEAVRIAESGQVTPGDHQRVLHGILGPIDVAEDPLRDREEPVATRRGSGRRMPPGPRRVRPPRDRDPPASSLSRRSAGRRSDPYGATEARCRVQSSATGGVR